MTVEQLDLAGDDPSLAIVPAFARHETFHPRYGWLKKGFDAAARQPDIFFTDDATTQLGVGKNMVRAIRYWCVAYKILEERPNPIRPRLRDAHATGFGELLLGRSGWDPFLEDPASLWLLHWQLLRAPCTAPAWYAIFNHLRAAEFTDETLANQLQIFCDAHPEWTGVVPNSLMKDARCLLRMYADVRTGRDLPEDSIASPFIELELVQVLQATQRHYTLHVGPKRSLPPAIVAFACVDFASMFATTSRLMTVSRLAHAAGSPGRAFQLTEADIANYLDAYMSRTSGLRLTQAAGTRQLIVDEALLSAPTRLLQNYYGRRVERLAA